MYAEPGWSQTWKRLIVFAPASPTRISLDTWKLPDSATGSQSAGGVDSLSFVDIDTKNGPLALGGAVVSKDAFAEYHSVWFTPSHAAIEIAAVASRIAS